MAVSALRSGLCYSKLARSASATLRLNVNNGKNDRLSALPKNNSILMPHFGALVVRVQWISTKKPSSKYLSESETDSDLESPGHRGESAFWRRKMRTFHGILDVNKDGVISFDDFVLLLERFVRLGNLTKEHSAEFRQVLEDLWEKRWGQVTPYVTVEQFLEDMHHVLNDKKMVRRAHSFLPYLFKAVDKDGSGEITVEEFKLFFRCLQLDDDDAVKAFAFIDTNGDGKISLKEFVKQGRDFFVTEEESHNSKYFWGPLVDH